MNYIKQELIEARSHKAASDDELGNVKGQMETLQNNITSLSEEGKLTSHCPAVRRITITSTNLGYDADLILHS